MILDTLASKWLNWRTAKAAEKSPEWQEMKQEIGVHKIEVNQGCLDAVLMHPAIHYIAEEAAALLNEASAENYVQFDLMPRIDRATKPIRFTVQWATGLSPAVKNARLSAELELVKAERDALLAEVERLKEERRWIPVGERLPEVGKRVLVWMINEYQVIACQYDGKWRNDSGQATYNVTHWMPLPPAPDTKGGE